jgi:hypothetical protein
VQDLRQSPSAIFSDERVPTGPQDDRLKAYRLHQREELGVMEGLGSAILKAYGVGTTSGRHWTQTPDSHALPVALANSVAGARTRHIWVRASWT